MAKNYRLKKRPHRKWGRRKRRKIDPTLSSRPDYSTKLKCVALKFRNDSILDVKGAIAVQLQSVPNYTTYTALWDQYRINKVVIKFTPIQTQVMTGPYDDTTSTGLGVTTIPRLCCVIDRDDITTAYDFADLDARQGSRTCSATKSQTWVFTPTRLGMVYRTGSTTGYTVDTNTKQYADCAQSDIPHYGLKYAIEPTSPSGKFQYRIDRTIYLSLKNRRE